MSEISDERLREYKANWEREIRALASHEIEGTYAIDMAAIIGELLAARPLLEAVLSQDGLNAIETGACVCEVEGFEADATTLRRIRSLLSNKAGEAHE